MYLYSFWSQIRTKTYKYPKTKPSNMKKEVILTATVTAVATIFVDAKSTEDAEEIARAVVTQDDFEVIYVNHIENCEVKHA
jgi:hypothetical protein